MAEDYGFEYTDSDQDEGNAEVENMYFQSKALLQSDPTKALQDLETIIELDAKVAPGEWGFRGLKQLVKYHFKAGNAADMMKWYRMLLHYVKTVVTRNVGEKGINSILECVSSMRRGKDLEEFYHLTLQTLKDGKNERLWFNTNMRLGQLYLDTGQYKPLFKLLKQCRQTCLKSDGTEDTKKGSQFLEMYSLEIQAHNALKSNKKLKELYKKSLTIKAAVAHPLVLGTIKECGGKMYMAEREWEKAAAEFFDAFRNFDEAGSPRRIVCLKYMVLARMLLGPECNIFFCPEVKQFQHDPEIVSLVNLLSAYERNDALNFERILRDNRNHLMDDPFIRNYIEDLLHTVRMQVLLVLVKPYTKIQISFISQELNISSAEVESLLVSLILDHKLDAVIDQVQQVLVLHTHKQEMKRYVNLDKWASQIGHVHSSVVNRSCTRT